MYLCDSVNPIKFLVGPIKSITPVIAQVIGTYFGGPIGGLIGSTSTIFINDFPPV